MGSLSMGFWGGGKGEDNGGGLEILDWAMGMGMGSLDFGRAL